MFIYFVVLLKLLDELRVAHLAGGVRVEHVEDGRQLLRLVIVIVIVIVIILIMIVIVIVIIIIIVIMIIIIKQINK